MTALGGGKEGINMGVPVKAVGSDWRQIRKDLVDKGIAVKKKVNGQWSLVLLADVHFDNPKIAAQVITGRDDATGDEWVPEK